MNLAEIRDQLVAAALDKIEEANEKATYYRGAIDGIRSTVKAIEDAENEQGSELEESPSEEVVEESES